MRYLVFLLAFVLAACSKSAPAPASPGPSSHEQSAARLRDMTVGLVALDEDNDAELHCSGVWVSETKILTAQHCVRGHDIGSIQFYVTEADVFPGGLTQAKHPMPHGARLFVTDEAHDLAMLIAPSAPANHPAAKTRKTPVVQGMFTQTMGHPLGLWFSYSTGVVSAVRELDLIGDDPTVWLQGTAPISPGNSGGGIFDEDAALIGICSRTFRGGENLNIWVPTMYIDALLERARGYDDL